MKLAEKGFQVTLTDLTPKLVKVAENKAKELELFNQFNGFHIMDAKDLNLLEDKEFDASLMMGPMYHLQNEQDRDAAKRMCLGGGNTAKNINARFFTHRFLFHSFPLK